MQKTEIIILVIVALVAGAILGVWLYPETKAASVAPSSIPTEAVAGEDFDQTFLEQMIASNQNEIDLAKVARDNAEHQEIKDLAEGIIAAQEKEIADMQQWQEDWGY